MSLIIPAYNEEENIGQCLDSVFRQTEKPSQIIVVNDGSIDNTEEIIDRYSVTKVNLGKKKSKSMNRYPFVLREGSKYLENYDFVGILDADVVLTDSYYWHLSRFLIRNHDTGLVGGNLLGEKESMSFGLIPYIFGCNRLYTRKCWEKINDGKAMKIVPFVDTYHTLKAIQLGFCPKRLDYDSYHLRPTRTSSGFLQGYWSYEIGYGFMYSLLRSIRNRKIGILAGYLSAMVGGAKVYETKSIVRQLHAQRIRRLLAWVMLV